MCQACLALARRKSGASNWPLAQSEGPASGRFAAAAEWADAPDETPPSDQPGEDDPPVDARRS